MTSIPLRPVARLRVGDRVHMRLSRFRSSPLIVFWLIIVAALVLPILLFLMMAFSPRLLDQGHAWFTLSSFRAALSGPTRRGVADSLLVGVSTAVLATALGAGVAWVLLRSDVPGRRVWSGVMFALLLTPSYLVALGWERLLEPSGVLDILSFPAQPVRSVFYGPLGVIVVLTAKGLPFGYLAVAAGIRGLGSEFDQAVRVHGGGRLSAIRVVLALLGPALWSSLAIVFAESVSDFGVAATLANDAHFPVATFTLYNAVDNFPVQFPVAAAIGWILLALAGLALLGQQFALRGRSYRVLSGRSRAVRQVRLRRGPKFAAAAAMLLVAATGIGVPAIGAVSASLVKGLGSLAASHSLTLDNYRRVLSSSALRGPLLFSAKMALVTATVAVALGAVTARMLTRRGARLSARTLDLVLLTAVALPGIVFAAGYIFAYNLPVTNRLGIHLYETAPLLVLAYVATALPSVSRLLFGSASQLQESMREAGRVHGGGAVTTWRRTTLPLLARPLVGAWVLTFGATLLELPVSELLYPPKHAPVSVGITKALSNYDFGGGTAMEVVAVLFSLAVAGLAWLAFRLLAPAGWRRIGRAS